ncbi:hypothetical protein RDV64_09810 [Acuticoccus sp. MNP-M23]|uniref:hypothetical protein n=1 Tax=Acuticoccus sp. MNP-M23 TaxID=3072793 RepID=UPI0028164B90|nr:hypothetical protein [Acuticoccus sp. MNP-M23]WMS44649.1 hypothetical protein RDV64_09810 [Acuticoccus sp. MNP-M23]
MDTMDLTVAIDPGSGGHDDLIMTIPLLGLEICADTYYFAIALEDAGSEFDQSDVKKGVASLLRRWSEASKACICGETVHLPFDFSDKHVGCIQLIRRDSVFFISYGYCDLPGYSVNPLKLGSFCREVSDFKMTTKTAIDVPCQSFLLAMDFAIASIEQEFATKH